MLAHVIYLKNPLWKQGFKISKIIHKNTSLAHILRLEEIILHFMAVSG